MYLQKKPTYVSCPGSEFGSHSSIGSTSVKLIQNIDILIYTMAKPLNSPGSLAASKWLLWNKPIKENKWHVYMTTFMVEGQYLCQILAKSEELNTTKNQFFSGVVSLSVFDFCISSPGPTINRFVAQCLYIYLKWPLY